MVVDTLRDATSTSLQWLRATGRTGVFVLKVLPMLPSRPIDLITTPPVVERIEYPTLDGKAQGDVYRPASRGPHPGMVICLGVVPFGVEHPQVPRLGEALARAGFAALLYWSPSMRDFRLDPEDIENIALAYRYLSDQPYVDAGRSGLLGTCVGGSFALMAAASPLIRDQVAFVAAFAPYGSLLSLARDIASSTRALGEQRIHWRVDPLTRKVFVYSVTARLEPAEAQALRDAYAVESPACDHPVSVTADGRAVETLLAARNVGDAEIALTQLPQEIQAGLRDLSPVNYLNAIQAPLIAICHDRDDEVVPVGESRLLQSRLGSRAGLHYTEFAMFEHADPTKRKLSPLRLVRQLAKFYLWLHAVFREAAGPPSRGRRTPA
jgi:dipeptidyl aminopeptidase/acylaminoacyl peptidase